MAGLNLMGYNAMALGPNELALGLDVLQKRMAEAQFPMLSANVAIVDTGQLLAGPYTVLEVGGHQVGVIGLTRVPETAVPGFQVLDPQVALAKLVPELAQQAATIIVLTNLPYQAAQSLASVVPGVDLLIAARPEYIPAQAVFAPGTGAIILSAEMPTPRHTGRRVGRLTVTVGADGKLSTSQWQTVPMGPEIADDDTMRDLLKRFSQ